MTEEHDETFNTARDSLEETEENDKSFDAVRDRLEEIVDEVNADDITLEQALALYEEAVQLGLAACDLSEQDALELAATSPDDYQISTSTE